MGKFILKTARDVDLYVEWDTRVEFVTFIGDRDSTLDYLVEEDARQHVGFFPDPGNAPEDRLRRADEFGTSALFGNPRSGGWDSSGFIVEQRGVLRRADLLEFAEAIEADDKDRAYGLLQPFEDDAEGGAPS